MDRISYFYDDWLHDNVIDSNVALKLSSELIKSINPALCVTLAVLYSDTVAPYNTVLYGPYLYGIIRYTVAARELQVRYVLFFKSR
jgi:hypothetical protein